MIMSLLVEQITTNLVAKQIKICLNGHAARYSLEKTFTARTYGAGPCGAPCRSTLRTRSWKR